MSLKPYNQGLIFEDEESVPDLPVYSCSETKSGDCHCHEKVDGLGRYSREWIDDWWFAGGHHRGDRVDQEANMVAAPVEAKWDPGPGHWNHILQLLQCDLLEEKRQSDIQDQLEYRGQCTQEAHGECR